MPLGSSLEKSIILNGYKIKETILKGYLKNSYLERNLGLVLKINSRVLLKHEKELLELELKNETNLSE